MAGKKKRYVQRGHPSNPWGLSWKMKCTCLVNYTTMPCPVDDPVGYIEAVEAKKKERLNDHI